MSASNAPIPRLLTGDLPEGTKLRYATSKPNLRRLRFLLGSLSGRWQLPTTTPETLPIPPREPRFPLLGGTFGVHGWHALAQGDGEEEDQEQLEHCVDDNSYDDRDSENEGSQFGYAEDEECEADRVQRFGFAALSFGASGLP